MGYNDPQPKGINSLGVSPFLALADRSHALPSARLGISAGESNRLEILARGVDAARPRSSARPLARPLARPRALTMGEGTLCKSPG